MFLDKNDLKIIKDILQRIVPQAKVLAFGSRVTGKNLKPFSDLDLAIKGDKPASLELLSKIKEEFSNSDLPFRVDIVDYNTINESFARSIDDDCEVIL